MFCAKNVSGVSWTSSVERAAGGARALDDIVDEGMPAVLDGVPVLLPGDPGERGFDAAGTHPRHGSPP